MSSSNILICWKEFLAIEANKLPIPDLYTSEAIIKASGFLSAKKAVFSPFPNPISKTTFV
jgi:hypothetical protein